MISVTRTVPSCKQKNSAKKSNSTKFKRPVTAAVASITIRVLRKLPYLVKDKYVAKVEKICGVVTVACQDEQSGTVGVLREAVVVPPGVLQYWCTVVRSCC